MYIYAYLIFNLKLWIRTTSILRLRRNDEYPKIWIYTIYVYLIHNLKSASTTMEQVKFNA